MRKQRNVSELKWGQDEESMHTTVVSSSVERVSLSESVGLQAISDGWCLVLGFEMLSSALTVLHLGTYCGHQVLPHAWLQC